MKVNKYGYQSVPKLSLFEGLNKSIRIPEVTNNALVLFVLVSVVEVKHI